jgi:hypothetical protein
VAWRSGAMRTVERWKDEERGLLRRRHACLKTKKPKGSSNVSKETKSAILGSQLFLSADGFHDQNQDIEMR